MSYSFSIQFIVQDMPQQMTTVRARVGTAEVQGAGSEINWDTLYAFVLIKLQSVVRDGNMVVGRRSTIFQILTSEFK
jgi:hypothetical protein